MLKDSIATLKYEHDKLHTTMTRLRGDDAFQLNLVLMQLAYVILNLEEIENIEEETFDG